VGEVKVVHPYATALAPADLPLAYPNLPKPAGAWHEVTRLWVGKKALFQREQSLGHPQPVVITHVFCYKEQVEIIQSEGAAGTRTSPPATSRRQARCHRRER